MASLPIVTQLTYNSGDGTYEAAYIVPQDGSITVSVVLLKQGGLYAEYFNNAFLDGVPAFSQVDSFLDFEWGTDLIT